jgi:hypothetical protein
MTTSASYSQHERSNTIQPPIGFLCPLLNTVMMDPVMSAETGIHFEHMAILAWHSLHGDTCPVTGGKLGELVPNKHLQEIIYDWAQGQYVVSQFLRARMPTANTPYSVNHNIPASFPDSVPVPVHANFTTDVQNSTSISASSFFIASRRNNKKPKLSPEALKRKQEQTVDIVRDLASSRIEIYAKQIERKAFKKRQPYQSKSIFKRGARLPIVACAPSSTTAAARCTFP